MAVDRDPIDFDSLTGGLTGGGLRFDPSALKQLAFRDIPYAATGAAFEARCDNDLVIAERERRLSYFKPWIDAGQFPDHLAVERAKREGMFTDIFNRMMAPKNEALPSWTELSSRLKVYFLLRCLMSHGDAARERLTQVQTLLNELSPIDIADESLMGIIRATTEELLSSADVDKRLDITLLQAKFSGYDLLTRHLTPWEKAISMNNHIRDYHCTAGCFRIYGG